MDSKKNCFEMTNDEDQLPPQLDDGDGAINGLRSKFEYCFVTQFLNF